MSGDDEGIFLYEHSGGVFTWCGHFGEAEKRLFRGVGMGRLYLTRC
jgi:hypothetical protein